MSKEAGPREKALRQMREDRYATAQALIKMAPLPKAIKRTLKQALAEAELARKGERQKVQSGIRSAAKAGKEVLERAKKRESARKK